MLAGHGAALDVPAGAAGAVGAGPGGLAGLGGLPDGEVGGVLFQVVVHLAAQLAVAALQFFQVQVAELAVLLEGAGAEVDVAVLGHVAVALVQDVLHDVQDLLDVLGGAGAHGGGLGVQAVAVLDELGLELLGDLFHAAALLLGLFDELVVDVGDVGDKIDLVAPVLKVPAQGVEHHHGPGVADVDVVVDGGAADVNAVLPRRLGDELLFFAGQRIVDLHTARSF